MVPVRFNGQTAQVPLIVVPGKSTPLFGRNWLDVIRLDWQRINVSVDSLLKKYAEVFKGELGTLKDYKVHLSLKDSAVPKFLKPRAVPFCVEGCHALSRNSNGWPVWGSSKVLVIVNGQRRWFRCPNQMVLSGCVVISRSQSTRPWTLIRIHWLTQRTCLLLSLAG